MHVGFDCKPRCRQKAAERDDIVAIESEPIGQFEPPCDAAFLLCVPVMIDQALPPDPSECWIVAPCDQMCVLDRDHRLIVVTVERPRLDLTLGAVAAMQQVMERVQAVIAAGADLAKACLDLVFRQQTRHSEISRPSSATSQPLLVT